MPTHTGTPDSAYVQVASCSRASDPAHCISKFVRAACALCARVFHVAGWACAQLLAPVLPASHHGDGRASRALCGTSPHARASVLCAVFLGCILPDCIHREFCTRINICALCMGWCLHRHTPSMRTDCHMIGKVRFMRQENGCKAQHQFLAFQLYGMLQRRVG